MEQFTMKTAVGTIHCCQWLPEAEPIGVVQIIHGVAEYAARYNGFASFLAAHGFVVVGEDHPGHGQSVEPGNSLGYLQGGWKGTVQLVHQLYTRMKNRYPGLPYFMLGHSMGSFLLRTYLYTYHADLAGAVLCGTNWLPKVMVMGGLLTCREEEHRLGERSTSPLIQKLMFGSFNEKFAPNRTPYDWVCSDPAVVDAYAADPFALGSPPSSSAGR